MTGQEITSGPLLAQAVSKALEIPYVRALTLQTTIPSPFLRGLVKIIFVKLLPLLRSFTPMTPSGMGGAVARLAPAASLTIPRGSARS